MKLPAASCGVFGEGECDARVNSQNKKVVQEQIVAKQKYAAQGQLDISYLWTDEGWLYLSIVLDLFNCEVVGWSLKPRMTTDIVSEALTMAWFRRKPAVGLMHHSDRGNQYASQPFQDTLKA